MRFLRFLPLVCVLLLLAIVLPTSAAGTITRVSDINPGSADSFLSPPDGALFNGHLYFAGFNNIYGRELWRFDGSTASLVTNIRTGTQSSDPRNFVVLNGVLYFFADDATFGKELFRYDGISVNRVTNNIPEGYPFSAGALTYIKPVIFNGAYYFHAGNFGGGGPIGLWKFDGSNATLVKTVDPHSTVSGPGTGAGADLQVFQNHLYFVAANDTETASDLCRLDASDTFSCITNTAGGDPLAVELEAVGNTLYFVGMNAATFNWTIQKYDGASVTLALDVQEAHFLKGFDGKLFFGETSAAHGVELWQFDGTSAIRLTDINPGSADAFTVPEFVHNGSLYFRAKDPIYGYEYWAYNGSTVQRFTDFATHPSPDPLNPNLFFWIPWMIAENESRIYMVGYDSTYGNELWVYDETTPPTITNPNTTTFYEGVSNTFTVTATGTPSTMTYTLTGALPAGVSFNPATGVLSGTPAIGTVGSYPVTITASNGVLPDASQSFTLVVTKTAYVGEPLGNKSCTKMGSIVNMKLRGMIVGRSYTYTMEVRDGSFVYMSRQFTMTFAGPAGTQTNFKWIMFPVNDVPALNAPQTYWSGWTSLPASVTLRVSAVDRTTNLMTQTNMTYTCADGVVMMSTPTFTPNVTGAPYAP